VLRPTKITGNPATPENPARQGRRWPGLWLGAACLALLLPGLTGCKLLRFPSSQPTAGVKSLHAPTAETNLVSLSVMESQVMRFADVYASVVAQAADDLSAKLDTPEGRYEAQRWKLGQATAIYVDATGPNPSLNALDTLVLVSLARMVAEDHFVKVFGSAALPLLETHRRLEAQAWLLAGGVLTPPQQQELKDLIAEWRRKNPDQRYVGAIRFMEFVTALEKAPKPGSTGPTSIFSLLFLDPMAGLDPTVAAIEETRLLGERGMYYTQRLPTLLGWQIELLAYQMATQPESKQLLVDADRLSKSAEIFARTGQELPQVVNDQRQAAIEQLLDGLKSQSADVRQTLNAGGEAATAINSAVNSLAEFVRYVSPPVTNPVAAGTNSKPFNVLDYGRAAGQVADSARDLNTLLLTLNQTTPQLGQLRQQAADDADRVLQHAFRYGVALTVIVLTGSVLAGLCYRALANRLGRDGRKAQTQGP
jgi:hypothetical protein